MSDEKSKREEHNGFVTQAAYDQLRWERDIAVHQLKNDYGVNFGEARPTAKWIWNPDGIDWNIGGWQCEKCGFINGLLPAPPVYIPITDYAASHYCAQCGVKMDGWVC